MKSSGKGEMNDGFDSTILGTGVANVKAIVDMAKQNGTQHFIIEQESYQAKTPLECAAEDLKVLKGWGY